MLDGGSLEVGAVVAHGVEGEIAEKGVGGSLADGPLFVIKAGKKMFSESSGNGGVLEEVVDD
jgi:hypothetical protein